MSFVGGKSRAARYLSIFLILARNRRGLFGLIIIGLFALVALAAPLLTPYDPVFGRDLAPAFAKPSWYSLWDPELFVRIAPISDPAFSSENALRNWELSGGTSTSYSWSSSGLNSPGSVAVSYSRVSGPTNQTVTLATEFTFEKGPPRVFMIQPSIRLAIPPDLDRPDDSRSFDDPIELRMYLHKLGDPRYDIWNGSMTYWSSANFGTTSQPAAHMTYTIFTRTQAGIFKNNISPPKIPSQTGWFEVPVEIASRDTVMRTRFSLFKYADLNQNGARDAAEPIVFDLNSNDTYETGEQILDGTAPPSASTLSDLYQPETADPATIIFHSHGTYRLEFQITFKDTFSTPLDGAVHFDDLELRILGDSWGFLGTDQQGRDIFSQMMYGARVSMGVGLFSAGIAVLVGLFAGLVAGYVGGLGDEAIMRFTDMLLVLPILPLLIVLVIVLGQSIYNIILVLGFLGWMGFARLVRSQVVSLKERSYVEAARAVGAGKMHILGRHVLPSVMGLTYVTLATSVPGNIIAEAALSFLGLGDPLLTSWGGMLRDVQIYQGFQRLWWVLPPGIAISMISIAFILIGYALDEVLNPRLRIRR